VKDALGDSEEDGELLLGGPEEPEDLSSHGANFAGGSLSFHNAVFESARGGTRGSGGGGGSVAGPKTGPTTKRYRQ
jgi:hypothetical protein